MSNKFDYQPRTLMHNKEQRLRQLRSFELQAEALYQALPLYYRKYGKDIAEMARKTALQTLEIVAADRAHIKRTEIVEDELNQLLYQQALEQQELLESETLPTSQEELRHEQ